MAFEKKDNSGAMFVNDRKEADNHPDRRGDALIDGVEYWVSGWVKEGKKGKWLSLSFKRKDQRGATTRDEAQQGPVDLDSEIPF